MTEKRGRCLPSFRSVKVETGLASDTYVEITSGLSEGDLVCVAESSKNSSSFMMMMDGGMGTSGRRRKHGGSNRGGSGGRQKPLKYARRNRK